MKSLRDHLNILFNQAKPELLFANIEKGICGTASGRDSVPLPLHSWGMSSETYFHYSHAVLPEATPDEVDELYENMAGLLQQRKECAETKTVFSLLPEYTTGILQVWDGIPFCKQEEFLDWRKCYFVLGQDILTTAHLAYWNKRNGIRARSFAWPAQIGTTDLRLRQILERGLAENHFHLNGSSRIFDLSWICLMNHPKLIGTYFGPTKRIRLSQAERNLSFLENLNISVTLGSEDNTWTWSKRLRLACWLRAYLFEWMLRTPDILPSRQDNGDERPALRMLKFAQAPFQQSELLSEVENLRFEYGYTECFKQLNGRTKCLDYAITKDILGEDGVSSYRILTGERAFLYHGFSWIFSEQLNFDSWQRDFSELFYLYLLLKQQFRSEMIQINERSGFKNFSLYESRKDMIFDRFPEYTQEARRTAVNAAMNDEHVISHELRITPKSTPYQMFEKILETDKLVEFGQKNGKKVKRNQIETEKTALLENSYFYTIHFVKQKEPEGNLIQQNGESLFTKPRHYQLRRTVEKQAKAVAAALEKYNYLCARVRGIDACNLEIGCRPEVFATTFRFLHHFIPTFREEYSVNGKLLTPKIAISYHVGEDFLDLVNGLRAMDEAVRFLEMGRGDRIGHGLALGIEPEKYYKRKQYRVALSIQERLDDLIWVLYRSGEFGVELSTLERNRLEEEAAALISEIYGPSAAGKFWEYYQSWKLRGDDPELYRNGTFQEPEVKLQIGLTQQYARCRCLSSENTNALSMLRKNETIAGFYRDYHYDAKAKSRGRRVIVVSIDRDYVKMVRRIQDAMQIRLEQEGIGIECNPSSNILIGPFERYDEHPIFRFCPVRVGASSLFTSVNTDDQGIFDTSLENEYALLAKSMEVKQTEDGDTAYGKEEIYLYLERVRCMGIAQTFPRVNL